MFNLNDLQRDIDNLIKEKAGILLGDRYLLKKIDEQTIDFFIYKNIAPMSVANFGSEELIDIVDWKDCVDAELIMSRNFFIYHNWENELYVYGSIESRKQLGSDGDDWLLKDNAYETFNDVKLSKSLTR